MARTSGSDDLYRLIHSLTAEEKGYFKKFAQRHSLKGNKYLQLFDAVNKQTAFEESSLRKKFSAYATLKVYLKDMIMDSLIHFARQGHAHIDLMMQIQKVLFLVDKGMQAEALKLLDKTIVQAEKMELFEIHRYLLRIQLHINLKRLSSPESFAAIRVAYSSSMSHQAKLEANLLEWEIANLDATESYKKIDVFKPQMRNELKQKYDSMPSLSTRSDIEKAGGYFGLYYAAMSEEHLLEAATNFKDTASNFKQSGDSSFNDVSSINNYLLALGTYQKHKEQIEFCDKVLKSARSRYEYSQLVVRCVIYKTVAYVHMGQFEQAYNFLKSKETEFYAAVNAGNEPARERVFVLRKVMVCFLNKQYTEAWLAALDINTKKTLLNFSVDYTDLRILELMIQYMMGNFDLLKDMAVKYRREFTKHKIQSVTYDVMLAFFSKTPPTEYKVAASVALQQLKEYYSANKKFPRKIFAMMRCTYWLEEIAGGKTMRQLLQSQMAANK